MNEITEVFLTLHQLSSQLVWMEPNSSRASTETKHTGLTLPGETHFGLPIPLQNTFGLLLPLTLTDSSLSTVTQKSSHKHLHPN